MKHLRLFLLALLLGLGVAACDTDGPAEEAGEEIDEAAEEIEDAVD